MPGNEQTEQFVVNLLIIQASATRFRIHRQQQRRQHIAMIFARLAAFFNNIVQVRLNHIQSVMFFNMAWNRHPIRYRK